MLVSAVGNSGTQGLELLELLFDRDQSKQVTDAMIREAAGGGNKRMMELLLLRNQSTEITEEFFEAAAVNRKGAEVIPILLEHNGQIRLSGKVVKVAARRNCKKVVEMLFARADVRAAELLLAAAENLEYGPEVMDFLLT
jgi:N-acetyl-gamma-glutamylphosphate reductase